MVLYRRKHFLFNANTTCYPIPLMISKMLRFVPSCSVCMRAVCHFFILFYIIIVDTLFVVVSSFARCTTVVVVLCFAVREQVRVCTYQTVVVASLLLSPHYYQFSTINDVSPPGYYLCTTYILRTCRPVPCCCHLVVLEDAPV